MIAMFVSFVHGPLLENTSKCNGSFYLFHTKIPNYHRVTRISADTPGWYLKFFYELSQKFKRFFFIVFIVLVVVVSLYSEEQKTKPRACQHHLRIIAYRFVLTLYIEAYTMRHALICARFCPARWFPFCTARYREKQQNTLLILMNFNFQESVKTSIVTRL